MLVTTELLFQPDGAAVSGYLAEPIYRFCSVFGYMPEESIFFDIETTGLSASTSIVFLIGAVYCEQKRWFLKQFLAQNAEDEAAILQEFFLLAQTYHTLIHFNGTAFDLPYIRQRADSHGICPVTDRMVSIDLYQYFRPLRKLLRLPRMNQQTLEAFLNWPRRDQLTGKHMISLFKKYTCSKEKKIADLLLLHNHDDLIGMTQLLRLASYLLLRDGCIRQIRSVHLCSSDSSGGHLCTASDSYSLPPGTSSDSSGGCLCTGSDLSGSSESASGFAPAESLCILLQLEQPLPDSLTVTRPVSADAVSSSPLYIFTARDTEARLSIPVFSGELKYFFPDYRNYYYLPLEDQAIHKSVGAYVDTAHRKNACPETCYTRKTGRFLPQPAPFFSPVFRTALKSGDQYFEYCEKNMQDAKRMRNYVQGILSFLLS